MDLTSFKEADEEKENGLASYPVAQCSKCQTPIKIYICSSGHDKTYCKDCLMATHRHGNSQIISNKCLKADCGFVPLFAWK